MNIYIYLFQGAISKIRHHSIPVSEFPAYNGKRRKHKTIHKLEYSKVIHAATKHSANVARSDSNVKKNQEASAVPFDYNRVILSSSSPSSPSQLKHNNAKASVPSFSSSSSSAPDGRYINASYISNYKNPRAWIVSQGPMENTVNDFWSMVWENRSPAIIMLTKTYEIIKVMCYQYWPLHLNKKETYGQISVTTTREEIYAHYKVRTHEWYVAIKSSCPRIPIK